MDRTRTGAAGPGWLVAVGSLLAVGLVVAGAAFYRHASSLARQRQRVELVAIAELKARQLQAWHQEHMSQAERLARNPLLAASVKQYLANPEDGVENAPLLLLLSQIQQLHDYRSVALLDATGTTRLIMPANQPADPAHQSDFFLKALHATHPVSADLHQGTVDPGIHLSLWVPIGSSDAPDSTAVAVLRLQIDPAISFYPMVQAWPTPSPSGETMLVRREGSEVLYLNDLRHRQHAALGLRTPVSATTDPAVFAACDHEGAMEGRDYRGVPVLALARRVEGTPWRMVAKVDLEEINAPLRRDALTMSVVLLALLVAAALGIALAVQRAQQALGQRVAHIFQFANEAIFMHDDELRILEANERAVQMYGYPAADLLAMTVRDLRAPAALDTMDADWQRANTPAGLVFETLHRHRDGHAFPVEVSTRLVTWKGGQYRESIVRDITERRRAAAALQASEERLRLALDAVRDALWDWDLQTHTAFFSPRYYTMLGYEPGAFPATLGGFMGLLHPGDQAAFHQVVHQLETGQQENCELEFRLRTRSGEYCWVKSRGKVVTRDAAGRALRILGTHTDITRRRLRAEELAHSRQRYQQLFDDLPTPVWEEDFSAVTARLAALRQDGVRDWAAHFAQHPELVTELAGLIHVLQMNQAALALYGASNQEQLLQHHSALFTGAVATVLAQEFVQVANGQRLFECEVEIPCLDGSHRHVLLRWCALGAGEQVERALVMMIDVTARMEAEHARVESEQRLSEVLENAMDAAYRRNLQADRYDYLSPAIERLSGFTPAEFSGLSVAAVLERIHEQDRAQVLQALQEASTSSHGPCYLEYRFRHRAGHYAWFGDLFTLVRDAQGTPISRVGGVRDISEQKRAEQALREYAAEIADLYHQAPCGYHSVNADGLIIRINDTELNWLGYTRDEVVDRLHLVDLLTPAGQAVYREAFPRFRREGRITDLEYDLIRKDGTLLPVLLRATALYDAAGQFVMSRTTVFDITDRRRAEEAASHAYARHRSILASLNVGVALLSPELKVIEVNRQLRDWFPDVAEASSMVCHRVLHPEQAACAHGSACTNCPVQLALASGTAQEAQVEVPAYQGRPAIHYRLVATPARDAQGQIAGVVELVEDITQVKLLEAQLRQASKMESIGRLAGGVAHDFNNLLTVISGYTQLLQGRDHGNAALQHDLAEIGRAADRAADLTRRLLAFSRRQPLQVAPVDLNARVEQFGKLLHRLLGEDVRLTLVPAPDLGLVNGDAGQLEQVLMNLAVNARDAMPAGGELTIATSRVTLGEDHPDLGSLPVGDYVCLSVRDTGCGMSATVQARIFEPFFTTKEVGKGTGLGLAMVYGIMRQHGGDVRVTSRVGAGSTFRLYLPCLAPVAALAAAATAALPAARALPTGNETILLVEDDDAVRRLLRMFLTHAGYQVLAASSAAEAAALYDRHLAQVALVLTDVVMAGTNGRQLVAQLRARTPTLRVIFMSGHAEDTMSHQDIENPLVNFIQKPCTAETLAAMVRRVLDFRAP